MKIYLAHPITGLTYDAVVAYYRDVSDRLWVRGYKILCPMTAKGYLRTEKAFRAHGYENPASTNHAIVGRDSWMVKQADVVFVDLIGTTAISIGCMIELGWAWLLGKHTVVAMEKNNIHRHGFVLDCAHIVFDDLESALVYLELLANPMPTEDL